MKTIKKMFWSLLPVLCMALAVSCTEQLEEQGGKLPNVTKDSIIKLSKNKVDASLSGGTFLLEYTIENPHPGEKISAKAEASWVKNFNYGITGALGFEVEANNTDSERQCLVTVSYRYADDAMFVVKQGAKNKSGFQLENVQTDYFSYTIDIIPDNKTAPYIVMSADPTYVLSSGFQTGEDYYEDDYLYFGWLGSFYGMSAVDVMNTRAKIGVQRGVTVKGAASGVPYTCYLYYFDDVTGALTSDVALFTITTKTPDYIPATFSVNPVVDGCVVSADVLPENFEGAYYFDMLNGVLVESYIESLDHVNTPADAVKYYWSMAVNDMMVNGGMSGSAIVDYYNCQGEYEDGTPRSHYDFELLANHTYYLFAFAMDENGLCCSEPQIVEVTTGSVPMSDNVITPSVSKVTSETAYISFTTTNDDFYIAGWEKASDWATFGNTDAERQQYLLTNRSYEFIVGDYAQNVIGLEEGVEYVLYAFGSRGGVATTAQIYTCPFTTKSGVGAATIDFVDHGYFIAADVAEIPGCEFFAGEYYSGKVILPVEYKVEGEWQAFFQTTWDWTGRYDEYNDEQYKDNLVWSINEYGSMTLQNTYIPLDVDRDYTLVALIIDADGVFSNVTKLKVHTSYDGANTDLAEFEAFWDAMNGYGSGILAEPAAEAKTLFSNKIAKTNKVSKRSFETPAKMDIEK